MVRAKTNCALFFWVCQTHYKIFFETQTQMVSRMSSDRCALRKLAMRGTQKVWPPSSTFIIACRVRQLFHNHFHHLGMYKYRIWKMCFLSLPATKKHVFFSFGHQYYRTYRFNVIYFMLQGLLKETPFLYTNIFSILLMYNFLTNNPSNRVTFVFSPLR